MSKKVLIIDDEQDICKGLQLALTKAGYTVETSTSAKVGIEKAKKFIPDVILMDVKMPMIDGFAATRYIKRDPDLSHIPVVIFTGEAVLGLAEKAGEAGAVDYFTKPYDSSELTEKIEQVTKE